MSKRRDELRIKEMIANGDIIEAAGNLWDLPLPTYKLEGAGAGATQQLIDERETYQ